MRKVKMVNRKTPPAFELVKVPETTMPESVGRSPTATIIEDMGVVYMPDALARNIAAKLNSGELVLW